MSRKRRPTLSDVAELANVHPSIVSKALNGRDSLHIRQETRERILWASRELRYRPNAMGRGLRLAQTSAAGILVPSLRNLVMSTITQEAFRRAWEHGLVVTIVEATDDSAAREAFERLVSENRIDGLLVLNGDQLTGVGGSSGGLHIPTIFLNRRSSDERNTSIYMAEERAARLAVEHFHELGHREIVHIGPLGIDTAHRRDAGFRGGAVQYGPNAQSLDCPYDEGAARRAAASILSQPSRPTAIFASNINIAIGALAAARDLGLSVPGDLSILSYDDDPILECLDVRMTALSMPLRELARTGVDALMKLIDGDAVESSELATEPQLVLRNSTGPAPLRG